MIDTLIKELDTEMTEAETNEKLNQEDYEEMMADSAAKRAADSKSLAQREGAKADNLSNVEESLVDDKEFLAELQKSCDTKEKEWAEICKTQSEELLALANTINILNDDDALELFKKTLPGATSFLQVEVSTDSMRQQALSLLQSLKASKKGDRQRLDFIMLAVRGKKVGFDKIIKMIDVMVALLKEEQEQEGVLRDVIGQSRWQEKGIGAFRQ